MSRVAKRTGTRASVTDERRVNVLLVDDRPENLLALEQILESLDQNLVTATSGEEALKCLLNDEFAVILLDVQMPGMDGFETAARIKQHPRSRDTPIIFLTAISRALHHHLRGYEVGAVDSINAVQRRSQVRCERADPARTRRVRRNDRGAQVVTPV